MKKLLSLLSVLTISGTAIPTAVAASPYQNNENVLENNNIDNNISSFNLTEKEFYYNEDKKPVEVVLYWYNGKESYNKIDVNLGKINPTLYNKIIFFDEDEMYSKVSWGDEAYWGQKMNDIFLNKPLKNVIKSIEVKTDSEIHQYADMSLLSTNPWYLGANMLGVINTGITFYWDGKNKEWHLQILGYLYGKTWGSVSHGGAWVNFGKGFRLYQ